MTADLLDVAYVAKGALDARTNEDWKNGVDEGEIDYLDKVLSYLPVLAEALVGREDRLCSVYAYDVVEPFGYEIGQALLRGIDFDPERIANRLTEAACR